MQYCDMVLHTMVLQRLPQATPVRIHHVMCDGLAGKEAVTCTDSLGLYAGVTCWATTATALAAALAVALAGSQGALGRGCQLSSLHAVNKEAPLQDARFSW